MDTDWEESIEKQTYALRTWLRHKIPYANFLEPPLRHRNFDDLAGLDIDKNNVVVAVEVPLHWNKEGGMDWVWVCVSL